jgi:hypothetical protein
VSFNGGEEMLYINKLIESENKTLRELGWLFYNSNANDMGLDKDGVHKCLKLLVESDFNKDLDDEMQKAYDEGYEDALNEHGI